MQNPAIYLVIEEDLVIAEDLGEMVRGHAPGADIRVSTNHEMTLDLLGQLDALAVAIIDVRSRDYPNAMVAEEVIRRGGRVIVLYDYDPPPDTAPGMIYIRKPFTSQMIADALADQPPG